MNKIAGIGGLKISKYASDLLGEDEYKEYEKFLDGEIGKISNEDLLEYDEYFEDFEEQTRLGNDVSILIGDLIGENKIARTVFELAMYLYINPNVINLYKRFSPYSEKGVTLELGFLVYAKLSGFEADEIKYAGMINDAREKLRLILREDYKEDNAGDPRFYTYSVDGYVISFLMGENFEDALFEGYSSFIDHRNVDVNVFSCRTLYENLFAEIDKYLSRNNREDLSVILSGEKESGRSNCIRYLSKNLKKSIFVIDYDFFKAHKDYKNIATRLVRECYLKQAALLIKDIKKNNDIDIELLLRTITANYQNKMQLPIFLTCRSEVKIIPFMTTRYLNCIIPKPDAEQCYELWKGYLSMYGYEGLVDIHALASKMKLEAGKIKRIVEAVDTKVKSGFLDTRDFDIRVINRLCYEILDDGRYENVKHINTQMSFDDLKINETNREILKDIVKQVESQEFVYNNWNLTQKYRYGRAITVLLAGQPGTGKTMSVHVMASALGLELYKVDLSQVVDKYVGETQKRLEEIFERAEKSNMILFFDEADAVFGKRNETKDANDKYSNSEIAYILQRIEEFDGILFLATNYIQNLDNAFMRRIRYVLHFDIPDAATRKEIWMSAFPTEVPLSDNIDFDTLANNIEISGGDIKNIVFNAIYYAASDNRIVEMKHIIKALYREQSKGSRVNFMSGFEQYRYLLV